MNPQLMLNPDPNFVRNMRRRIKQQNGFCPCKLLKIPENKCPCKECREQLICECGLYLRRKESGDVRLS